MAFMRTGPGARNFMTGALRRIRETDVAANPLAFARMSTQSSIPPSGSNKGQGGQGQGQGKKTAFMATLGGMLTFGGAGYLYKTYTDEKFGFENQYKSFGWEKPAMAMLFTKVDCAPASAPGSEIFADCADDCGCEKKCEESTCLRRMDKEEEQISKANADLEKALKDVKPKMMEATEIALKAYCDASESIKVFMDKAYCAIEEDNLESPRFEEVWCDVYEASLKRCEKVKDAMTKGQGAWELSCRLREIIENGKSCKYTQCNPLLITAEETLLCAERELLNGKSRMDCLQSESRLVEQYRNIVEDFRRDLKAEVESLLTGKPECRGTLTDNECTMIITHAYKKILRIQKELSDVKAAAC